MILLLEEQSGLSRQMFAKKAGITSSSYYDLIAGDCNLQLGTLAAIADRLGVSQWYLIGVSEDSVLPLPEPIWGSAISG